MSYPIDFDDCPLCDAGVPLVKRITIPAETETGRVQWTIHESTFNLLFNGHYPTKPAYFFDPDRHDCRGRLRHMADLQ